VNKLQSGNQWYNLEGTRAVNQAIGRVIRHRKDYGAILLCDYRFGSINKDLSRWLQPHVKHYNDASSFGRVIGELARFFRNAKTTLPQPVANDSQAALMQFEQDENNGRIKIEDLQPAKQRLQEINNQQIKIENANEIYTGSNNSVKKETTSDTFKDFFKSVKPTTSSQTFLGGLNTDVSTIDFNSTARPESSGEVGLVKIHSKSQRSTQPLDDENAPKRRKLLMVKPLLNSQIKPLMVTHKAYNKPVPIDTKDVMKLVS